MISRTFVLLVAAIGYATAFTVQPLSGVTRASSQLSMVSVASAWILFDTPNGEGWYLAPKGCIQLMLRKIDLLKQADQEILRAGQVLCVTSTW